MFSAGFRVGDVVKFKEYTHSIPIDYVYTIITKELNHNEYLMGTHVYSNFNKITTSVHIKFYELYSEAFSEDA